MKVTSPSCERYPKAAHIQTCITFLRREMKISEISIRSNSTRNTKATTRMTWMLLAHEKIFSNRSIEVGRIIISGAVAYGWKIELQFVSMTFFYIFRRANKWELLTQGVHMSKPEFMLQPQPNVERVT